MWWCEHLLIRVCLCASSSSEPSALKPDIFHPLSVGVTSPSYHCKMWPFSQPIPVQSAHYSLALCCRPSLKIKLTHSARLLCCCNYKSSLSLFEQPREMSELCCEGTAVLVWVRVTGWGAASHPQSRYQTTPRDQTCSGDRWINLKAVSSTVQTSCGVREGKRKASLFRRVGSAWFCLSKSASHRDSHHASGEKKNTASLEPPQSQSHKNFIRFRPEWKSDFSLVIRFSTAKTYLTIVSLTLKNMGLLTAWLPSRLYTGMDTVLIRRPH